MPLDPTQPFQVTLPDASHTFRVGFAPDRIPFVEVYVGDDLATPKFTINRPDIATTVAMLAHALHESRHGDLNRGRWGLWCASLKDTPQGGWAGVTFVTPEAAEAGSKCGDCRVAWQQRPHELDDFTTKIPTK